MRPIPLDMEAGVEYVWDFNQTVRFSRPEAGKAFVCGCGATLNPPYCDGSHKKLVPPEVDEVSTLLYGDTSQNDAPLNDSRVTKSKRK